MSKIIGRLRNLSENNKIVLGNIVGAFTIRGLALIVSVFTMPAYINFFNNEIALGLWFTIVSVLNWILNFDLGIGNGLRNHLTRAVTQKNRDEIKRYISSAYITTGILCVVVSLIFFVLFDYIDWNTVFNIDNDIISSSALLLTVRIVFLSIMLQLFFKLISSVLFALQKSSVNGFLSLSTSLITLLCVLLLPSGSNDKNMIVMAVVHGVAVIFPLLVATVIVFAGKVLKGCLPRVKFVTKKHAKDILTLGGIFLYVQIMYMIIMSTNEYLITLFSGNGYVLSYQIYSKPFHIVTTVFYLAQTPIWSAVAKALSENNQQWIKKIYKKMCIFAALASGLELIFIPFLQPIINLWLGDQTIAIDYSYGVAFACLFILQMFNGVFSTIENGMNKLRNQIVIFTVGAIVKIPIAWLLVRVSGSWIGVIWANVVILALYCFMEPFYIKKILNEKETKITEV